MDVKENTKRFVQIVEEVLKPARPEEDWDGLLTWLKQSDFFTAPASTMFHNVCTGGLCDHVLNVYDALKKLVSMRYGDTPCPYSDATLAIVALFHDLSKTNLYCLDYKNKKSYHPQGSKADSLGRYDWITEEVWTKRNLKDSFTFGRHEDSSVFMLQRWVTLTYDEIIAILHHTGYTGEDFNLGKQFTYAFCSCPLAALLHLADTYASFLVEPNLLLVEGK